MWAYLRNTPKRAIVAWYWIRATDLYDEGRFGESLDRIRRVGDIRGTVPPEFLILTGLIRYRQGDYKLALAAFFQAHKGLGSRSRYGVNEANYLKCFCVVMLKRVSDQYGVKVNQPLVPDYSSCKLRKVPGFTRSMFPLPDHPDWPQPAEKVA